MQQTQLILVNGKVQGVFFRQSSVETAVILGITGTVRNLPDGSVQIVATGPSEKLEQFVNWCHKGPRQATVNKVIVQSLPLQEFASFSIVN
jgi:acylphosphatase